MIIDIEHEYPFALTVDNVDSLAGRNNPFHKMVRGFGILRYKQLGYNVIINRKIIYFLITIIWAHSSSLSEQNQNQRYLPY